MIFKKSKKQRKLAHPIAWRSICKISLIIALIAISFLSVNKIKRTNDFPIHHVKVYGAAHMSHRDVQHALMPLVTRGFFAIDVDAVKEQLLQLPWVANASVWRIWPDQMVIAITERIPVARWNQHSLLSTNGEIFTADENTYPQNLPQFIGPEGEQINMLENFVKMSRIVQPLHNKIAHLELSSYLAWSMTLDNGIKVNLGYKDILTRTNHFVKVYRKIVGKRAEDVEYVDLRYPNGLAVKWKSDKEESTG